MAFSEAQKADIRFYLGWSARFHQFDSRLEQAMTAMNTEPDSEALIVTEIAACKAIDVELDAAHPRLKALKVGSIALPGPGELAELRKEGKRHVGRIATTLGVEIRDDVYEPTSVKSFAGYGGLYQDSSNYIGKA